MNSTAAQLTGETLLQYITTKLCPSTWHGTLYEIVFALEVSGYGVCKI
jgi:hypothetical protein